MHVLYWVSLPYIEVRVHMCLRSRLSKILKQRPHCIEVLRPQNL